MDCAPQCRTALVAIRRMGVPGYFLLCYRHRLRKVLLKLRDRQRLIRSSFVGSLGYGLRASMPRVTRLPSRSRTYRADRAFTDRMVGHVIEIEHCLRRVSRAVYGVLRLVLPSRGVGLSAGVCGLFRSTRTYQLGTCGTTEAHHIWITLRKPQGQGASNPDSYRCPPRCPPGAGPAALPSHSRHHVRYHGQA